MIQAMKKRIYITYKYRLDPTKEQQNFFAQFAGSVRFVFNKSLEKIKQAVDAGLKIPTYTDLTKRLPYMKAQEETAWLSTIHSQILQQGIKDLSEGVDAFFSQKKQKKSSRGFPKFKKKGQRESFRYPQSIRCKDGKVYLPKIGWVRYRDSRPIEGVIKQAAVKLIGQHWYVCIACSIEIEVPEFHITEDTVLGIDVGIKNYISASDGMKIDNPSHLKHMLEKLRHLSKSLSRKKKGSKNWFKMRAKIQRLHIRITNCRRDFLHKQSTVLTDNQGVRAICIENLSIAGMVKNRKLARAISDASWGTFYEFLKYKCEWRGKKFLKVDRFYPSSKLCSSCGNKQDMPLHVRVFDCTACGMKLDRDINASINIRSAGTSELISCGEIRAGGLNEAGIGSF